MDSWEYMSAVLVWDGEAKQWKVTTSAGSFLRGESSGEALNPEGEQGWELVNVIPTVHTWSHKTGEWSQENSYVDQWNTTSLRAFFKRRKP